MSTPLSSVLCSSVLTGSTPLREIARVVCAALAVTTCGDAYPIMLRDRAALARDVARRAQPPGQAGADALSARLAEVADEFPEWQVSPMPGLVMWSAFWSTPDGRSRRTIGAPSLPALLDKLRAIRGES
jgi:hypothetical protein